MVINDSSFVLETLAEVGIKKRKSKCKYQILNPFGHFHFPVLVMASFAKRLYILLLSVTTSD